MSIDSIVAKAAANDPFIGRAVISANMSSSLLAGTLGGGTNPDPGMQSLLSAVHSPQALPSNLPTTPTAATVNSALNPAQNPGLALANAKLNTAGQMLASITGMGGKLDRYA